MRELTAQLSRHQIDANREMESNQRSRTRQTERDRSPCPRRQDRPHVNRLSRAKVNRMDPMHCYPHATFYDKVRSSSADQNLSHSNSGFNQIHWYSYLVRRILPTKTGTCLGTDRVIESPTTNYTNNTNGRETPFMQNLPSANSVNQCSSSACIRRSFTFVLFV